MNKVQGRQKSFRPLEIQRPNRSNEDARHKIDRKLLEGADQDGEGRGNYFRVCPGYELQQISKEDILNREGNVLQDSE